MGAILLLLLGPAAAAPIDTLAALGPALSACFAAPAGSAGSQATVRFSLSRDGTLIGRPRLTYTHLVGPPALQRAFLAAVLDGLQTCTPLAVTPALGAAIAGRPLSIRFVGGGKAQPI